MALPIKSPSWVQEFQKFIMRGSVVDLAVGIIIGAAFSAIVGSLVKDIFTPVIGLILGGIDFTNIFITLKGPHVATLAAAQAAGAVTLNIGVFMNAVINFVIIGFAIFWVVKGLSALHRKEQAAPAEPPPPTKSEVLLEDIRDLLAREVAK